MKRSFATTTLYGAAAAALIGFSTTAAAAFNGYYIGSAWQTIRTVGTGGSVDLTSAPVSVTLKGSDNQSNLSTMLLWYNTAPAVFADPNDKKVSFSWGYKTEDQGGSSPDFYPGFDPAGFFVGALPDMPSDTGVVGLSTPSDISGGVGAEMQGGTASFDVMPGQKFGFFVYSEDNLFGGAELTISDFSAPLPASSPLPVPEPESIALLALGFLGIAATRKNR